ncbi:MAG: lamin tail domain-containing protein [Halobacteriales archaeon]
MSPTIRHRAVVVVVLFAIVISGCAGSSPDGATAARSPTSDGSTVDGRIVTIVEVIDGDTMRIRYPNGSSDTVRLLGVDTPEVHTATDPAEFETIPDTTAGRQWLGRWGQRASEFARDRLAGARVRIRTDPRADRRGGYGRLLVYLYHDGQLFNLQLLRQGYARLYESQFTERDRFTAAEGKARTNGVGLWEYGPSATAESNDSASSLAIVTIHADAPGNDHDNLNEEYVRLRNTANKTLTLTGWTVADAAGHTYTFPDGFTLDPNETVTLHTGRGTDSTNALYWGRTNAVWNNDGDRVTVRDVSGVIVVERAY